MLSVSISKHKKQASRKRIIMTLTLLALSAVILCEVTVLLSCPVSDTAFSPEPSPHTDKQETTAKASPSYASCAKSTPFAARISARNAVLIHADTGEILFGQNEHARAPMASTTKIMTALVALEALPVETEVKITAESVGIEGSSIYLTEGEVLTLEALLYALMLESANDAATAIAIAVSGDVQTFAERMNQKAAALGLKDTHFVNPHGLDDPEHYTTAYELAIITKEALKHPVFQRIVATQRTTIPHQGASGVRLLLNHNKLLRSYDGAVGVKTGFTKKTGRCLVSAAKRDGLSLIAVTLHAPDDWRDHTAMLDYGFSLYEPVVLATPGQFDTPLDVVGGTCEYVMIQNPDGLVLSLPKSRGEIIEIMELPRFLYAPVSVGETIGRCAYYELLPTGDMQFLGEVPLYAGHSAEALVYKKNILEKLLDLIR